MRELEELIPQLEDFMAEKKTMEETIERIKAEAAEAHDVADEFQEQLEDAYKRAGRAEEEAEAAKAAARQASPASLCHHVDRGYGTLFFCMIKCAHKLVLVLFGVDHVDENNVWG